MACAGPAIRKLNKNGTDTWGQQVGSTRVPTTRLEVKASEPNPYVSLSIQQNLGVFELRILWSFLFFIFHSYLTSRKLFASLFVSSPKHVSRVKVVLASISGN